MIILDTCILIFDALTPEKLSKSAKKAISYAEEKKQLFCSDISLWEIAMFAQKKRLDLGTDVESFLNLMLKAKEIHVLSISVEIAVLSSSFSANHFDPADRIIAATALHNNAKLITCDKKLLEIDQLSTIW